VLITYYFNSKINCSFTGAGILLLIHYYEIIYCFTIHLLNVRCIYCYYYPRISNYIRTSTVLCSHWIYTHLCRDLYIATDKENSRLVLVFFKDEDLNQYLIGISFDLPPIPIPSLREGGSDFHIEKDLQSTYIFI
jgi:hypothetical protein